MFDCGLAKAVIDLDMMNNQPDMGACLFISWSTKFNIMLTET